MKIYKGNVEIKSNNVKEWEKRLADCEKITGYLYINSNAELKALKSVGGYLSINSNAELKAESLKSVGVYLSIYSNAELKAESLKSVGGDLSIYSKISPKLATTLLKSYKNSTKQWYLSDETNKELLNTEFKK